VGLEGGVIHDDGHWTMSLGPAIPWWPWPYRLVIRLVEAVERAREWARGRGC
jgi:hypothetical protein